MFVSQARRRRRTLPLVAAIVVVAIGALVVVALLVRPEAVEEPPAAEPEPEPEPEPVPDPVVGEFDNAVEIDLSVHGTQLFGSSMPEDEPVPVVEREVDAFVADVVGQLNQHLTALQLGEPGLGGAGGLVGATDVLDVLGPDLLAERVVYHIVVGVRGEPEWARVEVFVDRNDGSNVARAVVFVPGSAATLVAAEPLDGEVAGGSDATAGTGADDEDGDAEEAP